MKLRLPCAWVLNSTLDLKLMMMINIGMLNFPKELSSAYNLVIVLVPYLENVPCLKNVLGCVSTDQVQKDFAFSLFDLDWDVFSANIDGAINRVPVIEKTGIKSTVCGPGRQNIIQIPNLDPN